MSDLERITIDLSDRVTLAGVEVTRLVLAEPTVRDFIDVGPLRFDQRRRSADVDIAAVLQPPMLAAIYLRRGLGLPDLGSLRRLLASLPLVDGIRLHRALDGLVPRLTREEVLSIQGALAFDWKLMTVRESETMGVAEFLHTAQRLIEHRKRDADRRSR